jgi:glycosyltransferase involved in cell wall biosynthesis
LPEVAGSAAEYFDPHSSEDLARAIEAVVMVPSRRRQLVENGRIERERFSWSRCAAETAAVYRAVT